VVEAIGTGLEYVKPGIPVRILDEVHRKLLQSRGYPDYLHLPVHSVGRFYKLVIADFIEYKVESGMVFAYEPAVYLPEKGGARVEPHILVTSQGYQILAEYHRRLFN